MTPSSVISRSPQRVRILVLVLLSSLATSSRHLPSLWHYIPPTHGQLVALIESAKETRTVNFNLTTAQRQAVARLKRVNEVMETSLAHLDQMIAVFNDF